MVSQSKEALKAAVCEEIERRREDILAIGQAIRRRPELGFKEFETAARVAKEFGRLGIPYREELAITGVKGALECGGAGPSVAVMGELDALVVADHPEADPATGAAHACGHDAQIAAMVATAIGLIGSGVLRELAGRVIFMAVPAEEYVELEYRRELRRQGKLEFLGGKPELIRLGELDDVDMAMLTHLTGAATDRKAGIAASSNGCIAKLIQFIGRPSHAGGAPHQGVNALSAAMVALAAINAQRETFRDEDSIRVHPIITRGGDVVNVIPADVRMETYVRGRTIEAIEDAEKKVDRSLRAGALALGAQVKITTMPGYLPQVNDPHLAAIYKANAVATYGAEEYTEGGHRGGSTDMGDVEHLMPAIQPFHYGGGGLGHGSDYRIADAEAAYLGSAKLMAMTVVDLLYGDAEAARDVLAKSKPRLTKEEYLGFMRKTFREEQY
ncbi:MAG: amidohydrolase [Chloroflexi bacterium]|nr:amidohydrolase [Chloroflexota bacterium]